MQSILTILPQPFYNKITKLWNELEKNFNVKWVKYNVPFPHITLAVEDINKENIGQITSYLSDKKLKYQIKLESLSLVHRDLGKEVEIDQTFGIPKRRKRKN
ncbi:hypothetical protein [Petrotoga olearia]|uniref:2'-5' RNA ligase n=2 Tax=Petrotoga olearia TaxID=156203 RepID=A0A2K1P080_9BACT|nr:hypothetical protein [Petrotoga olearia]PNR96193.1 hypothetical protein X929_06520 [Petrotoga olearia DSM 13574]RMA71572.1 hypothetical protein C8D75_1460 [Petrotoga olearia]